MLTSGCVGLPPYAPEIVESTSSSGTGELVSSDVADGTLDEGTTPGSDTTAGSVDGIAKLDLVIVIDNTDSMGTKQLILTRSLPWLVEHLETLTDSGGMPVELDAHVMVTTTDFGNPLCTPFEPLGYEPARGAPTSSSCTTRLADFTNLTGMISMPEVCTELCPEPVAPDDRYIAFGPEGDNIPDSVAPFDIDGDGDLDSPVARGLACIAPQGLNGCGYESPLETMLQALNPDADWNAGPSGFFRGDAMLAIVIVTDEADCSVRDYTIMEDAAFQNINPASMMPGPSSAICWNAGVTCSGPDGNGVYSDCAAQSTESLNPLSRYLGYLTDQLRGVQGKEVMMLGILGVPLVTARDPNPPFEPTAGGVLDLVYRDWRDGQYPAGDVLPEEWAMGVDAADLQFAFGIGPGCTGTTSMGEIIGRGIPPVRIKEVCQALDLGPSAEDTRCIIESICDDDYTLAFQGLMGMIATSL